MFEVKVFDDEDEHVDNVQTVTTHSVFLFLRIISVLTINSCCEAQLFFLLQGMVRQRHLYGGPRDPTDLPGQQFSRCNLERKVPRFNVGLEASDQRHSNLE